MHEWLEALRKSAKAASSGVSADEVRRAETECGVPFPEDLGHLYLTFDGGELHGDVSLFPLHGPEGSVSVLEKTRLKLVGLPAAGVWRIGMKGPHRHLFSARKSAMVEQGDGGGPLPGWVDALGAEDWLYGTWDSEKREMRLYRSLKDMLDVLVPPAEVESFGERTFARAMNAVLQEALSGMSGEEESEEEQAEESSTEEEEDTGAQRELAYEYDEDVSRGRRGGAQDESGGFGRFGAKSGGGKKPALRSSVTQAELFVRPTMQEALRKELGPETAKKPAVKSKASKPVATIAETVKDAVAKPVAQVAEAVKDAVSKPVEKAAKATKAAVTKPVESVKDAVAKPVEKATEAVKDAVSKPTKATKTAVTKLVDAAATATTKTVAKAVEVTQPKAKPAAQPVTETSAVLPATKSPTAKSATKSLATAKPGTVKSATQPSVAKTPAPAKSAATKPAVAKSTTKQAAAKKSATTAKSTTKQAAAKKSAGAKPTTKQVAAKKSARAKPVGKQPAAKKSAGKIASKKVAASKPAKKSAGAKPAASKSSAAKKSTGTKPARKSAPSKAAARKPSAKGAVKKPKSKR
ncbi:hypothetical protein OWM54_24710 [Myxococcus sp. MISCRS1]|uniref:SMI1/KNR4 family protein n=1 Tax=Myxococcus sp. MISCRS1 TaxID=2996786 RepID=UPI00226D4922|nr:hypothetical protein [Myxococcus sp. MISCRS1]MCY1000348.1 hypothetical protein [Myxococcus sp. MISCRS1]